MALIIKKYIPIAILLVVSAYIVHYSTRIMLSEKTVLSTINSQLYDVNIEMDLLEYIDENYVDDNKLKDYVKSIILKNMTNISVIRPDLNDLKGVPLSALKRVLDYNNVKSLTLSYPNDSFSHVFVYLVEIEHDINVLTKKKQDIFSKPFKENPWEIKSN